jgi:glycosyltransferase involved in cell wall biosynthesis
MKVLITIKCLDCPGGVAQIFNVLKLNTHNNIDYFIASPKGSHIKKFLMFFLKYFEFYKIIKGYDIIHINPSLGKTAIWRDLIYLLIARLRNKKVIVFIHGWEDDYAISIKQNRVLSMLFQVFNKSAGFIVLGNSFKQKLISLGIDPNKKFFIETSIADDRYINDFSINKRIENFTAKNKPIRFLFLSRITARKGIELSLNIFKTIQEKNSDKKFEFIIAGDGEYLNRAKKYVEDNHINNVTFIGFIKDADKHKILSSSDLLILTSESEGLPNVILEGMLYGLPIITTNVGAIADWVKNNKNGFIINSTRPEDFIPHIEKLLSNKELYTQIATRNHNLAKENFTKDVITKRYIDHYKKIYSEN